jgi:hypothetical protein
MDDLPEERLDAGTIDEGYPIAPSPPVKRVEPQFLTRIYAKISAYELPHKKPFQYTIADMFALTTAVAVFLSIFFSIIKLFPVKSIAGASGLGTLMSLILLLIWPPERRLIRVGWWVLFAFYLFTCIAAMILA